MIIRYIILICIFVGLVSLMYIDFYKLLEDKNHSDKIEYIKESDKSKDLYILKTQSE